MTSSPDYQDDPLGSLEQGDDESFQRLLTDVLPTLAAYAKSRGLQEDDAQDRVSSAIKSMWKCYQRGGISRISSDHLIRLLFRITERKLIARRRARGAQKRGGDAVKVPVSSFDQFAGREYTPQEIIVMSEDAAQLMALLPDKALQDVAQWKLEGYSEEEIADKLGCATRTVRRKVAMVKALWSHEA